MGYVWLKALHVAAVLVWTGGLLAQSLVVATAARGGENGPDLIASVRRWDRRVTSPALLAVWALGVALAVRGGWFGAGWLSAKLALVVLLSAVHGMQAGVLRRLAAPGPARPPRGLAWTPAISAISVLLIALLVVAKPL